MIYKISQQGKSRWRSKRVMWVRLYLIEDGNHEGHLEKDIVNFSRKFIQQMCNQTYRFRLVLSQKCECNIVLYLHLFGQQIMTLKFGICTKIIVCHSVVADRSAPRQTFKKRSTLCVNGGDRSTKVITNGQNLSHSESADRAHRNRVQNTKRN